MNYKYEMACKEAGMREEDIQALRREFDADYKRPRLFFSIFIHYYK